jgi:hypothetical protein
VYVAIARLPEIAADEIAVRLPAAGESRYPHHTGL